MINISSGLREFLEFPSEATLIRFSSGWCSIVVLLTAKRRRLLRLWEGVVRGGFPGLLDPVWAFGLLLRFTTLHPLKVKPLASQQRTAKPMVLFAFEEKMMAFRMKDW